MLSVQHHTTIPIKTALYTFDVRHKLLLYAPVNVSNKKHRSAEADSAQHKKEGIAHDGVVTEEEGRLHEPSHVRAHVVIVEAVAIYEDAR